jgi:Rieske Fe-S protein
MDPIVTRRTVLVVGAAGAGAIALAACSNSGSDKGTSAPKASEPTGATSSATGATSASNTAEPAGKGLAKLADITVGEAVSAELSDGRPAIVARPTDSTAACFSAKCTHMGCTVKPAGDELHCPCHGSVYDAVSGAVKQGPAPKALAKITVHVSDGAVLEG